MALRCAFRVAGRMQIAPRARNRNKHPFVKSDLETGSAERADSELSGSLIWHSRKQFGAPSLQRLTAPVYFQSVGRQVCTAAWCFVAVMLVCACSKPQPDVAAAAPTPALGCQKDVDCKGERVCEHGQCVAPASSSSVATSRSGGESDPFAYCAAVGVADEVDGRYTGPAQPATLRQRAGEARRLRALRVAVRSRQGDGLQLRREPAVPFEGSSKCTNSHTW
jgi:hypothetical protein